MITGRRWQFKSRVIQRGYTWGEVRPCIVAEDGDMITVDETHPAYPRLKPPSLLQKAANFAASAAKHIKAGMPLCTQEQIDQRFAICQGCEFYKDNACLKCGCPLSREKQFISKLSWANEKCPVGKWGNNQ
jgi:hypothetical protein